MPTRTRKRKPADAAADGETAPAAKTTRPAPKRQTRNRAKQADGDEAQDEGRNTSKSFFQQATTSKRRRLNAESAQAEIQDRADKLAEFIDEEQKKSAMNGPALGDALRAHLPPDCASIMSQGYYTGDDARRSIRNATADNALRMLKYMRESVKLYSTLAARDTGIKKPSSLHWLQDQEDLKDLNQYAMATAARIVNNLIIPNPKSPISAPSSRAGVVEKVAWELFDGVRPERMEHTWGRIAQGHVRAFTGILRSMQDG